MRFFLILLFLSSPAYADCFTTDIPTDGPFNCVGTLFIDTPLIRIKPDDITPLAALDITADNIVINANIIIDGSSGITGNSGTGNELGGLGGPEASNGGALIGNVPTSGGLDNLEDGKAGANDAVSICASGAGGGGGQFSAGTQGLSCFDGSGNLSGTPAGNGGSIVASSLIGGFGGGAGGKNGTSSDIGTGGGGGGAIRIAATSGTITIANGVRLSARGGNGGNSIAIGGAGGGGGGGFIHLISPTNINNQGVFDVRGGSGGINTSATFPRGGNGGRGGDGIFIIEQNSVQTIGTSTQDYSSGLNSSRSSLKSDISCGTLAKPNDNKNAYQMIMGFFLILMLSWISKTLFQLRTKI